MDARMQTTGGSEGVGIKLYSIWVFLMGKGWSKGEMNINLHIERLVLGGRFANLGEQIFGAVYGG